MLCIIIIISLAVYNHDTHEYHQNQPNPFVYDISTDEAFRLKVRNGDIAYRCGDCFITYRVSPDVTDLQHYSTKM